MGDQIQGSSGVGGIYQVGVTTDNQLKTLAVTRSIFTQINIEGDAYNINTGEITLTNDTETPVLYLKNNETRDLLITAVAVGMKDSTGGSDLATIKVIRNPATGTIVSGASAVDISSNRNYGSFNSLEVDVYKGATGSTMTDGTDHILFFQGDSGRLFAAIDEVIPKGTSIGVKITPPSGNTSLTLYVAIICHLIKEV